MFKPLSLSFLALLAGAALALPAVVPPAAAHDYNLGQIQIAHPWSRATPGKVGAGYMALTNKSAAEDRLVSAESAAAGKVEIHEMKMDGGVMRMRELERGLVLAPGATVELKPGGFHLMLMELRAPLVKDQRVPLTLVFEKAGRINVELQVEAPGAGQPAGEHKH